MKKTRKQLLAFLSIILVVCMVSACGSSTTPEKSTVKYPTENIVLICNYGAGGNSDLACRALAEELGKILGVAVTVENKAGGMGTIGIIETQNSKNDGYTIGLLTFSPMAIVPNQTDVPYTPEDFEYICAFGQYDYGVTVSADSGITSIEQLVDLAKKKGGSLSYATTTFPNQFVAEAIAKKEGLKFTDISYTSTPEAIAAVLGGHLPFACTTGGECVDYIEAGQLVLLASAMKDRWVTQPEVPTLLELGYDCDVRSYLGLGVPAGVDPQILTILEDAIAKAVKSEKFMQIMKKTHQTTTWMSGTEFGDFVKKGYAEYAKYFSKK